MAADPVALGADPALAGLIDDFFASQLSPCTREAAAQRAHDAVDGDGDGVYCVISVR